MTPKNCQPLSEWIMQIWTELSDSKEIIFLLPLSKYPFLIYKVRYSGLSRPSDCFKKCERQLSNLFVFFSLCLAPSLSLLMMICQFLEFFQYPWGVAPDRISKNCAETFSFSVLRHKNRLVRSGRFQLLLNFLLAGHSLCFVLITQRAQTENLKKLNFICRCLRSFNKASFRIVAMGFKKQGRGHRLETYF